MPRLRLGLVAFGLLAVPVPGQEEAVVRIVEGDGVRRVEIDGELFTEYIYEGRRQPILYPVIGAAGRAITRNYPIA